MTQTRDFWTQKAATLSIRNQAFIDGKFVAAASGASFDCISPIDGRTIVSVASCDAPDVDRAVKAARTAFEDGRWSRLPPRERKRLMLALAEVMRQHAEELALLETLDVGKPIRDAHMIDIPMAIEAIAWYAEAADKLYDQVAPTGHDVVAMVTREPMGVVGVVLPWNFPLMLACWKIGPALVAGNTVVIKPAEQSPLTAIRLAELALEAGIPPGVINVVPGFGPTAGKALGLHPDVDALTFTGSGEIGKMFMAHAAQSNMNRVSLECGGKSPNIIFADAPDIDTAARNAAFGIFYNQGEVCAAGSRLVVQESIKDEVLEKVIGWARKMQPGDPLDPKSRAGAIVSHEQTERICGYIAKGSQQGARLALGGKQVLTQTGGFYIEPTIFDGVAGDMTIAREEIFGPVLATLTFRDQDDAVRIANDTIYGLGSAIWTSNINTAHKMAKSIRAGSVWVNCYNGGDITTPFGGYRQSGFGRDKSLHAIDKYTELKTTWIQLG
jgi:gamma-glutamyl-gamma-aminobutyraldehyde dehydrogenase/4-guanidinobutyraldehyde dehydrogenase/NAD-dependent aldehyde dehydrogenase